MIDAPRGLMFHKADWSMAIILREQVATSIAILNIWALFSYGHIFTCLAIAETLREAGVSDTNSSIAIDLHKEK